MPDAKEGKPYHTRHEEDAEPYIRENEPDSKRRQAAEGMPTRPVVEFAEEAGETGDVVSDNRQEMGEDATAAEEEAVKWQVPQQSRKSPAATKPPISVHPPQSLPLTESQENEIVDSPPVSSDVYESAGETGDVVADSTQTGRDKQARTAEERSMEKDASRKKQ
jgi:hypothetical protein